MLNDKSLIITNNNHNKRYKRYKHLCSIAKKFINSLLKIYSIEYDLYKDVKDEIFKIYSKNITFSGHHSNNIILAIIYIVIRQKHLPYVLEDISQIGNVKKTIINRKVALIKKSYVVEMPDRNFNSLIERYSSQLKISQTYKNKVKKIIEENIIFFKTKPPNIAIFGTIYYVQYDPKIPKNFSQLKLAFLGNTSMVSLRRVFKYLNNKYK